MGAMGPRVPSRAASATQTASDDAMPPSEKSAFLYLVLEYRRPAAGGARWALADVDEVRIGRGAERRSLRIDEGNRVLSIEVPDGRVSTRHARLARLATGWAFEDLGSKNGSRLRGEATKRAALGTGDLVEIGETMFLYSEEPGGGAGDLTAPLSVAPGLATLCPRVEREYERLAAAAKSDVPILLLGETGTGKELAARAIHELSGRKGRFVAVNCGALPAALVEAELFGHRRGAFSGSTESRQGIVRSADHGTLFLDEIGDLALASQAALLRVLQEKEVTPLGETVPVRVDVRVVAATHHDMASLCDEGAFRLDLLSRLEGHTARLASLRERRANLGPLDCEPARARCARASSADYVSRSGRTSPRSLRLAPQRPRARTGTRSGSGAGKRRRRDAHAHPGTHK